MSKSRRIPLTIWGFVAGMCLFWALLASAMLPGSRGHDFLNIYTGASLALDGRFADLHSTTVQLAREQQFYPGRDVLVPFVRPSFYAAILSPLALLPYQAAFVAWVALQTALLIGVWVWVKRRFGPDALAFAALFLPGPLGIGAGQDCALILAIFATAYELSERKKYFASGAVLALMLIKFHLVLLWPLALLLQKRWKMLAGYCAAAAVEVAVSVGLGGIAGAKQYLALLQDKRLERLSPSPELMVSWQGLMDNLNISGSWAIGALLASVVAVYILAVRNAPLWRMFTLTALASLFIAPHVYAYDAALLLVPVMLTIYQSTQKATRIAAAVFSMPFTFGFALAGKPYSIVGSLGVLVLWLFVASDSMAEAEAPALATVPNEA
ncbi:MAG: glycosyltransferase family 87 protein [Bryobacteraceae bacterium]